MSSVNIEAVSAFFTKDDRPDLMEHYKGLTYIVSALHDHHKEEIQQQLAHRRTKGQLYNLLERVLPTIYEDHFITVEDEPYQYTLEEIEGACIATYGLRTYGDTYPFVDLLDQRLYVLTKVPYEMHQEPSQGSYVLFQPSGDITPFKMALYTKHQIPANDGLMTVIIGQNDIQFSCFVTDNVDKEENND